MLSSGSPTPRSSASHRWRCCCGRSRRLRTRTQPAIAISSQPTAPTSERSTCCSRQPVVQTESGDQLFGIRVAGRLHRDEPKDCGQFRHSCIVIAFTCAAGSATCHALQARPRLRLALATSTDLVSLQRGLWLGYVHCQTEHSADDTFRTPKTSRLGALSTCFLPGPKTKAACVPTRRCMNTTNQRLLTWSFSCRMTHA